MRLCMYFVLMTVILTGCAVDPTTSVQLTAGNTNKVNLLSDINKQITDPQTTSSIPKNFHDCLASHKYKGTKTLATLLSAHKNSGKGSISPITINSDNLSGYVASLWSQTNQNKTTVMEIIDLHRGQDRACFEQEILALQDKNKSNSTLSISDYKQSRKILIKTYDYIKSTLKTTEYSELDEQFARDHIPVRLLIPTS